MPSLKQLNLRRRTKVPRCATRAGCAIEKRSRFPLRYGGVCLGLSLLFSFRAFGEMPQQPQPAAFAQSRYTALLAHSPFSVASVETSSAPPPPSFAANWFVGGIARLEGADFVCIQSRDQSVNFSLYGGEPDPGTGTVLASIEWSDSIGKSRVKLRKGDEVATLEFNEAVMKGSPPPSGSPAATFAVHSSSPLPRHNMNLFATAQAGVNAPAARRPDVQGSSIPPGSPASSMAASGNAAFPSAAALPQSTGMLVAPPTQSGINSPVVRTPVDQSSSTPENSRAFSLGPAESAAVPSTPSSVSAPASGQPTAPQKSSDATNVDVFTTAQSGVNAKSPVPEVW